MSVKPCKYAEITSQGAILMGEHIVVDGYHPGREIGVVTHIHTDHIEYLKNAKHECSHIYMSPPTFEILATLESDDYNVSAESFFRGRHIHQLDFNKPQRTKLGTREPSSHHIYADTITLFPAQHILGSAQVLTETNEGKRIVYSSDFAQPGTDPIKCNILLLDSTHGSSHYDMLVDGHSLENRLIEYIDHEIQSGKSICIRAHTGRLQYLMHLLSSKFPDIPFITSERNMKIAQVYHKYDHPIKELMQSDTLKSTEMMHKSALFIEFKGMNARRSVAEVNNKAAVFSLGIYDTRNTTEGITIKEPDQEQKYYSIVLSDHANFTQILQYVKDCNPELVITDSFRNRNCEKLANSIIEELGINATHQPPKN